MYSPLLSRGWTRKWPVSIKLKEVGPRNGLQNEKEILSTEDKIAWINALSKNWASVYRNHIICPSKMIPQLGDAVKVAGGITRNPYVIYAALVPNMKGLEEYSNRN